MTWEQLHTLQVVKVFKLSQIQNASRLFLTLNRLNVLHLYVETLSCILSDFGFAKHLYRGDELHALRGSPLYMAPEIICKGMYDARVDLWSIGVILYGRLCRDFIFRNIYLFEYLIENLCKYWNNLDSLSLAYNFGYSLGNCSFGVSDLFGVFIWLNHTIIFMWKFIYKKMFYWRMPVWKSPLCIKVL